MLSAELLLVCRSASCIIEDSSGGRRDSFCRVGSLIPCAGHCFVFEMFQTILNLLLILNIF